MKQHPVSAAFPRMSDEELDALAADIKEHGQLHPVLLLDMEWVIDGWNRVLACERLGIEPWVEPHALPADTSLVDYVVSVNNHRRHLTQSQRAAIGSEIAKLRERESKVRAKKAEARRKAAKETGASERSVQRAQSIADADPDLHEQVKSGDVSLRAAERQVAEKSKPVEPEMQFDAVGAVIENERVTKCFDRVQDFKRLIREAQRIGREIEALADDEHGAGVHIDTATIKAGVRNIVDPLKWAQPHAVCPWCTAREIGGPANRGCKNCKGQGFVPRAVYERAGDVLPPKDEQQAKEQ